MTPEESRTLIGFWDRACDHDADWCAAGDDEDDEAQHYHDEERCALLNMYWTFERDYPEDFQ